MSKMIPCIFSCLFYLVLARFDCSVEKSTLRRWFRLVIFQGWMSISLAQAAVIISDRNDPLLKLPLPEDIQQALDRGFDDYWTKPLDFTTFRLALDRVFGAALPR